MSNSVLISMTLILGAMNLIIYGLTLLQKKSSNIEDNKKIKSQAPWYEFLFYIGFEEQNYTSQDLDSMQMQFEILSLKFTGYICLYDLILPYERKSFIAIYNQYYGSQHCLLLWMKTFPNT